MEAFVTRPACSTSAAGDPTLRALARVPGATAKVTPE